MQPADGSRKYPYELEHLPASTALRTAANDARHTARAVYVVVNRGGKNSVYRVDASGTSVRCPAG